MITNRLTGRLLILGYGNPARQDDGLGPAAAEALASLDLPGVRVEAKHQLNVEDAADAAEHDGVLFLDASPDGPEPFDFRAVRPAAPASFTTHHMNPEGVLAVCRQCFGRAPQAYLLAIRGYAFGHQEGLTGRARANLDEAVAYLCSLLPAPEDDR